MNHSPAFIQALKILQQELLPENDKELLEKLQKQCRSDEQENFGDLWQSCLFLAGPLTQPIPDDS